MGRRWYAHLAVAVCALLLALAGPAAAQLQTGNLYGTVSDEQGAALPGVTVTLTGVGANQVQVTDSDGQFRFLNLYPGTYGLRAELEGFSTVEYPDIGIRVGGNAEIQVTLSGAVQDVITVTGESPLLDERRLNQGSNVSTVELDKVPTARDPWSLLSQAPGVVVDRINVGGNESGQQSNFVGMGSSTRDNTFAVDGVILTDMNAVGASATYFDFGAFEEVQFTVSSVDVSVATAGVTINQVTKRGTNQWRGSGRYLRTDGDWQSDPSEANGNRIDAVEEYGAEIGGPLWRDHLWIWGSYGESEIGNLVPSAEVGESQLDLTQLEDFNTKLNFQTGARNSGVLHYWTNDKLKFGRGAGPDRAPGTTHDQTTPQDIYKIEDTFIPTSNFVITGLWARDEGQFTLSPQGGLNTQRFRDENGILQGSNYDFTQDAKIDQGRLDANYFFNAGPTNHELRFGGGFREQENLSGTVWPTGRFVEEGQQYAGIPDREIVAFPRNRQVAITSNYDSAWIQDTITLNRWTINAGLRYDSQTVENRPSTSPANPQSPGAGAGDPPLLPEINFAGNDAGGFEWETVVPRIGVTYALGEERKTLLRGTFSQYAEQLGQLPLASRVNPLGYSYAYFYFTDANDNLILDPSEFGSLEFYYAYNIDPANPSSLVTVNVNDPNLDPMMTDELTFGVEHALTTNFAAGLTLTYRNIRDIPETRLLVVDEATGLTRAATRGDFTTPIVRDPGTDELVEDPFACDGFPVNDVCGNLPNGSPVTPQRYYDLREGLSFTGGRLYTNGDREQDYLGLTLTFNRRLASQWTLRGHFTWNDWDWVIGDEFRNFDDPTDVVTTDLGFSDDPSVFTERSGGSGNKGDIFLGSRWAFGLSGLYQVAPDQPWGFNLAGSINGREGYVSPPFVRRASRQGIGGRNIQVAGIDEFRNDDIVVFDARIDKDFSIGDFNLNVGVDGFNLLNEDYVLQRERNLESGRANLVNERLSPRVFRVGATLRLR
jgi:hypothetical protein